MSRTIRRRRGDGVRDGGDRRDGPRARLVSDIVRHDRGRETAILSDGDIDAEEDTGLDGGDDDEPDDTVSPGRRRARRRRMPRRPPRSVGE